MNAVHDNVRQALEGELEQAEGRILAVRLVLTGDCPVHPRLLEDSVHLRESFRSTAAGLGDMWLEKVLFKTDRKGSLKDAMGEETPLAGLMTAVEQFELDAGRLLDLVPEVAALKNKLPPDLIGGDDPLLPTAPDQISVFLDDVRELLTAKLIIHGDKG